MCPLPSIQFFRRSTVCFIKIQLIDLVIYLKTTRYIILEGAKSEIVDPNLIQVFKTCIAKTSKDDIHTQYHYKSKVLFPLCKGNS